MVSSHQRRILIAAGVGALALLAAGCGGGGGSPQVASSASTGPATTTTSTTPQSALVAFSGCMRSHGVTSFPDPQRLSGPSIKLIIRQAVGDNPRYQAAMGACSHLLPNRGSGSQQSAQQIRTQRADALSFANCMRGHGLSHFPDPTAQGQLTVAMVQAQGIDVHSPAVLRIVQTCLPASHGALTPAKIREALANSTG